MPGITNSLADALSRKYEPKATPWQLPAALTDVAEHFAPTREMHYYTFQFSY